MRNWVGQILCYMWVKRVFYMEVKYSWAVQFDIIKIHICLKLQGVTTIKPENKTLKHICDNLFWKDIVSKISMIYSKHVINLCY